MAKTKKSKSKKQEKNKKQKETKQKQSAKKKAVAAESKKPSKKKAKKSKTSEKEKKSKAKAEKKSEKKRAKQDKKTEIKQALEKAKKEKKPVKLDGKTLIALIIFILVALGYLFKDLFIAAMVNGSPISRLQILKQAEESQGTQILDQLVVKELILQEAKNQGVAVSQEELQTEIDEIKQQLSDQGQDLEQILAMQGLSMEDVRENVRLQKLIEKLLSDQVEISDEEIEQFLEENQDFLPEDASDEELRKQAVTQLEQQKISDKYQELIQNLREQANIQYFVDYGSQEQGSQQTQ